MIAANLTLAPLDDAVAFRQLVDAAGQAYPKSTLRIRIDTNISPAHFEAQDIQAPGATTHAKVLEIIEYLDQNRYVTCKLIRIEGLSGNAKLEYKVEDDGVTATVIPTASNPQETTKLVGVLAERFSFRRRTHILRELLPQEWESGLRLHEQTVATLTEEVSRLGQFLTKQAERQSTYLDDKQIALDNRFEERRQALEKEYSQNSQTLQTRENQFKDRVAAFEVRESKYVRRDLLKRIQEAIEERKTIQLSDSTKHKRMGVHYTCLVTALGAIVGAVFFGRAVLTSQSPPLAHVIPLSVLFALLVTTIVYYIKWNNQWFNEHAQADFRNMQFAADILRANWLAELLFEWEKDKERELPQAVIERFSNNLFADERLHDIEHPADAILQVLKNLPNIRIDRDGVEVRSTKRRPK